MVAVVRADDLLPVVWGRRLISYVYHILQGDARDRWNDAAYHASAFEMEAYAHEAEANYLSSRRWFAFVKYYGKL